MPDAAAGTKPPKTKKREIVAHKGGRTERVEFRCTPEVKQFLNGLKGMSTADWIEQKVREELERTT